MVDPMDSCICWRKAKSPAGESSNPVKASGIFGKKSDRLWLPVSAYLIELPDCVESLANHETEIKPHVIEL